MEAGLSMIVISEAHEESSHDAILADLRLGESQGRHRPSGSGRPVAGAEIAFPDPVEIVQDGEAWVTSGLDRVVRITNPDKVFFPDDGYTKGDLIQFYASIAPVLLPHLARRALSMSRYPDGIGGGMFYEKQAPVHTPEWIVTAPIHSTQRGEPIDFVTATDTSSLVWLANMACIEMHPWLSRTGHHGNPDFAVFDFDPMEGATWDQVVHVTKLVNVLLERLGLAGYLKTSGATGIHLYVPIEPEYSYRRVRRFVETLGRMVAGADPENATMEWDIPRRGPRVFIDHNQNVAGKTIASVYSVRPRSGAPVSTPILWDELDKLPPRDVDDGDGVGAAAPLRGPVRPGARRRPASGTGRAGPRAAPARGRRGSGWLTTTAGSADRGLGLHRESETRRWGLGVPHRTAMSRQAKRHEDGRRGGCSEVVAPRADAVDPVDGDPDHETGRNLPHRELLAGTDVELGEVVHPLERSTFRDLGAPGDHGIRMEAGPGVLMRLEGDHQARVAADALQLVLVGEGGEHQVVPVEARPHHRDMGSPVRVEGDHVAEGTCGEQVANRFGYLHPGARLPRCEQARAGGCACDDHCSARAILGAERLGAEVKAT